LITTGYESLQLVAFFSNPPSAADAAALWLQNFPFPYASFSRPVPVVSVANGLANGVFYELHLQPGRVDLVIRPEPDESGPPRAVPALNDLAGAALPVFERILTNLAVVRLAAVSKHREPVASMADAVKHLKQVYPALPVADTDTDVSFQRSRPVQSAVQPNLQINHLVRWSTGYGMEMIIQIGPDGVPNQMPSAQHVFVEQFFDFNTQPVNHPDPAKIPSLCAELIAAIGSETGRA
jgi:hypothetical protein